MTQGSKQIAYLIGIKGVAMTALAIYLKEKGSTVLGSDTEEYFQTDEILKKHKITVLKGFRQENLPANASLVVATGAHGGATNPEAVKAKQIGIPFYMHGEYLGELLNDKFGIAVAGSHGKTTTSSLLAFIFSATKMEPSYTIGTAFINGLGPAGHYGKSKYFIAEADEYMTCPRTNIMPRFLNLNPQIAIISNIDFDHPDEFINLDDVKNAFTEFSKKIKSNGLLVTCIDDKNVASILDNFSNVKVLTYGFSKKADYRLTGVKYSKDLIISDLRYKNKSLVMLKLKIPGIHNLLNAAGAAIVAAEVGISWPKIAESIIGFKGSNRRFEEIFRMGNTWLYDDYAHHPSEIISTLSGIKAKYPQKNLIVIFQPHTYSRTKELLGEFSKSFIQADSVFISDIFASAREKPDLSINSEILVNKINEIRHNAIYIKNSSSLLNNLSKKKLSSDSIILTMGAGNLYLWHRDIINFIKKNDAERS